LIGPLLHVSGAALEEAVERLCLCWLRWGAVGGSESAPLQSGMEWCESMDNGAGITQWAA